MLRQNQVEFFPWHFFLNTALIESNIIIIISIFDFPLSPQLFPWSPLALHLLLATKDNRKGEQRKQKDGKKEGNKERGTQSDFLKICLICNKTEKINIH